jgi:hypothetical protein
MKYVIVGASKNKAAIHFHENQFTGRREVKSKGFTDVKAFQLRGNYPKLIRNWLENNNYKADNVLHDLAEKFLNGEIR